MSLNLKRFFQLGRPVVEIHKELVRRGAYQPEALGFWGLFNEEDGLHIEMLDGTAVTVDGPATLAAIQALPTPCSISEARAALFSRKL